MTNQIVFIHWIDSVSLHAGWEFKDKVERLPPGDIYTVGIVFEETEKYITVIQSVADEQIMGRLTIPKCAIQNIVNPVSFDFEKLNKEYKENVQTK